MTTSLAALAASSSTHSPSTVLMTSSSLQTPTTSLTSTTNLSSVSVHTSSLVNDTTDSNQDIKSEFYTREGLWKLASNGEYIRQQQQLQTVNNSSIGGQGTSGTNSTYSQNSFNEPVKLSIFKFTKNDDKQRNICDKCRNSQETKLRTNKMNQKNGEQNVKFGIYRSYDDDEDVVYAPNEEGFSNEEDESDENDKNDTFRDFHGDQARVCKYCSTSLCLDLVLFNYAREIYFYEFDSVKLKVRKLQIKANFILKV